MKHFLSLALCTLLAFSVQAQIHRGVKGNYNVEKFPQVSFIWNSPNPEVLNANQFVLTENETALPVNVKNLAPQNVSQKKSVLIIMEDMASHGNQIEFTRKMLTRFFSETTLAPGDKFNVVYFNRKQKTDKEVIKPLLTGFSDDKNILNKAITEYRSSKMTFSPSPNESDLYQAINEGVNLLKKEPADRAGVIVVVTRGLNMKVPGASTEMETVRQNALAAGIPLYVVKYTSTNDAPEVSTLAESTYGTYINTTNVDNAVNYLKDAYGKFDSRLYGQDYEITFNTTAKRDGKAHPINLSVSKVSQDIPALTAPNVTFGLWVKENLILFIALVLLLILIIVLVVVLIVKRNQKQEQERIMSENRVQDALNHQQQEMERQRREAEQARMAEMQRRQAEEARKNQAAQAENLANLMRTKNLYPRLQCKVNGASTSYTITKPVVTLGRNANNDVVLNNQTVSGLHAEIRFNGAAFEVVNRSQSYTRGIIVNGQFYQQIALKNGDIIGLGEAVITFYM